MAAIIIIIIANDYRDDSARAGPIGASLPASNQRRRHRNGYPSSGQRHWRTGATKRRQQIGCQRSSLVLLTDLLHAVRCRLTPIWSSASDVRQLSPGADGEAVALAEPEQWEWMGAVMAGRK